MGGGLSTNNPVVVDAFHAALRWQSLVALALAVIAALAWAARNASGRSGAALQRSVPAPEHPGRRVLRVSFGILWIVDGALQAQSAMPLGLPGSVVRPAAASSPGWVQHLVDHGLSVWSRHPVPAAASAVWIQIGIGALLLLSPRGSLSRLAGVLSVYWALLVWVLGEAFGGMFGTGVSWMFGAPGAALIYGVAGVLLALPERAWDTERLGRWLLGGIGASFVAFAVLQAWPGRGFWQGQAMPDATAGGLVAMADTMSQTPQPHLLSSLITSFGRFDASHGWAVNLAVVAALAAVGIALTSGRPDLRRAGIAGGLILCAADWVVIQDLGVLGGLGTDPNSMVPTVLLIVTGALAVRPAITRSPSPAAAPVPAWRSRPLVSLQPATARLLGVTASISAFAIVLLGAIPMASASVSTGADAVLTKGVNGTPDRTNVPAPAIDLVDQHGARVTLASLRGRTVALTFLDPVCTTDCPIIAQQFRQVDDELHATSRTAFVAVVANPVYRQPEFVRAFDHQERLDTVPNWYFLTGSLPQLAEEWRRYGIEVQTVPGGAMVAHSDNAFVIDPAGRLRVLLGADPGDDSSTAGSLGTVLAAEMRSVMGS